MDGAQVLGKYTWNMASALPCADTPEWRYTVAILDAVDQFPSIPAGVGQDYDNEGGKDSNKAQGSGSGSGSKSSVSTAVSAKSTTGGWGRWLA